MNERVFCSDERELRRRDSAHEIAYRILGMVVIFAFFIGYLRNSSDHLLNSVNLTAASFDPLLYGLLMVAFILFLSLPQAILLWTEPDMEEDA